MAKARITDALIKKLPAPAKGNSIWWDSLVPGFGVRITAAGHRAFVLQYELASGKSRRYTIGSAADWRVASAREEARRLRAKIRSTGLDPVGEVQAERSAPTVGDMVSRYVAEYQGKKRPSTQRDERSMIGKWLQSATIMGGKVSEITYSDIAVLHRKISKAGGPYRGNRVIALLSKMFSLSIKWRWRLDNPCRGIERNSEHKRQRYLTGDELSRLTAALADFPDLDAANAIRLLVLTGARKGEVLAARWQDLDLNKGVWSKPGSTTKQATLHRVPLSAPARQLLAGMPRRGDFVFPGRDGLGHRTDLKRPWPAICQAAKLDGVRLHDLRHSFASVLASSGVSLHIIGGLLGHTQPATTARYSHLTDAALRAATERAGAIIESDGQSRAEIVNMKLRKV